MIAPSSKPVEQLLSSTYQVRTLTRGGKDKPGHTVMFKTEKEAVEFACTVRGGKNCRVVKCEIQETVIELQRYETPKEA